MAGDPTKINFKPEDLPPGSPLALAIKEAATANANAPTAEIAQVLDEVKDGPSVTIPDAKHDGVYPGEISIAPRPYGGATSFVEYDQYREASEIEYAINEVTWTFDMLVENIMRDPELTASEKAVKLGSLASDAAPRIAAAEAEARAEKAAADPALADPGNFMTFRDKAGDLRWLAIHSNNYQDREGETFSAKSHEEYVEWVDEYRAFPALRVWHMPLDLGKADIVDYDGAFMISSGTFSKEYEHVGEALKAYEGELGCSHGFQYRPDDLQGGVYQRYRSFEVSVLPLEAAANTLTAFFARGDLPMITEAKREFLTTVGGDGLVKTMEATLGAMKNTADAKGMSYKEVGDGIVAYLEGLKSDEPEAAAETPAAETPAAEVTEPEAETPASVDEVTEPEVVTEPEATATEPEAEKAVVPQEAADTIIAMVTKAIAASPLATQVEQLVANQKTLDQAVADAITPGNAVHRSVAFSQDGPEVDTAAAEALKNALDSPDADGLKANDPVAPYIAGLRR